MITSLNTEIDFQKILAKLNIQTKSNTLPTQANCPVCNSIDTLNIYPDPVFEGEWLHCINCKTTGNIIEFIQKLWNTDIDTAIDYCIPDRTAKLDTAVNYLKKDINNRVRANKFWQDCQVYHTNTDRAELRILQRKLNLHKYTHWTNKMGKFVGSSHKRIIKDVFHNHVFTGKNWEDTLIIPFVTLPGQISGFVIAGRNLDSSDDWFFRRANRLSTNGAGIAMFDSLTQKPHPQLQSAKFIFTDLELALSLQSRHFLENNTPLPIAASWDDGAFTTQYFWNWYKDSNLIFWGTDPLKTIKQAKLANAKVSLYQAPASHLDNKLKYLPPIGWLRKIRSAAVPWEIALQKLLKHESRLGVERALVSLNIQNDELTEFIDLCDTELTETLTTIKQQAVVKKVKYNNKHIYENNTGWYIEREDNLLTDAIVRIKQIDNSDVNNITYYGEVVFKNQTYEFKEAAVNMDNKFFDWLYYFLRDTAKAGICSILPTWNKFGVHIAFKFHKPEYITSLTSVGWDKQEQQYVLPNFSVHPGGKVTHPKFFTTPETPAIRLPTPGSFHMQCIKKLSIENKENSVIWATLGALTANALACPLNRSEIPILLNGPGATTVGEDAALAFGCIEGRKPKKLPDYRKWLQSLTELHNWPVLFPRRFKKPENLWLNKTNFKNYITSFPGITGPLLAINYNYNVITECTRLGEINFARDVIPCVFPNYLQYIFKKHFIIPYSTGVLAKDIILNMADWFKDQGGNKKAVLNSLNIIQTQADTQPCDYLLYIILLLNKLNKLKISKASLADTVHNPHIIELENETKDVWVDQNSFSAVSEKVGAVQPNLFILTESLKKSNALKDQPNYQGKQGWLIDGNWWKQQVSRWINSCKDQ